jgi:hypothetical protein
MIEKSAYKGKMMGMEYTPDDAVLAEMGKVTIRHSFLDWTLNRTIKTMTDMTPQQADFAFASEPSASLRRKVIRVAKHCFGKESATFKRVNELMKRCESVTKQRNRYTHNLWLSLEGTAVLLELAEQDRHMVPPTAMELKSLADTIRELYAEINAARMKGGGFLHEGRP